MLLYLVSICGSSIVMSIAMGAIVTSLRGSVVTMTDVFKPLPEQAQRRHIVRTCEVRLRSQRLQLRAAA